LRKSLDDSLAMKPFFFEKDTLDVPANTGVIFHGPWLSPSVCGADLCGTLFFFPATWNCSCIPSAAFFSLNRLGYLKLYHPLFHSPTFSLPLPLSLSSCVALRRSSVSRSVVTLMVYDALPFLLVVSLTTFVSCTFPWLPLSLFPSDRSSRRVVGWSKGIFLDGFPPVNFSGSFFPRRLGY